MAKRTCQQRVLGFCGRWKISVSGRGACPNIEVASPVSIKHREQLRDSGRKTVTGLA
jgi:hypothetical protein